MYLAVGDHNVRPALEDGLDQVGDALLGVLVVPVRVNNNVRTELESPRNAVMERAAQTLVPSVADEFAHAVLASYLNGPIS
jgi:hypothetical protein